MRQAYRKISSATVVAVQLDLDFSGFNYVKWGNEQHCNAGDWLVNNDGDIYTVDKEVFAKTYSEVGTGQFRKIGEVWAEQATSAGAIETLSGKTDYLPGDYLVSNNPDGTDAYAMTSQAFNRMYQKVT